MADDIRTRLDRSGMRLGEIRQEVGGAFTFWPAVERPYRQCGPGECRIPSCGPPWCLPDGGYTGDRLEAETAKHALRRPS